MFFISQVLANLRQTVRKSNRVAFIISHAGRRGGSFLLAVIWIGKKHRGNHPETVKE